jgi:hypothetical protein
MDNQKIDINLEDNDFKELLEPWLNTSTWEVKPQMHLMSFLTRKRNTGVGCRHPSCPTEICSVNEVHEMNRWEKEHVEMFAKQKDDVIIASISR